MDIYTSQPYPDNFYLKRTSISYMGMELEKIHGYGSIGGNVSISYMGMEQHLVINGIIAPEYSAVKLEQNKK